MTAAVNTKQTVTSQYDKFMA